MCVCVCVCVCVCGVVELFYSFVQLGELGEELSRDKPSQSKVEMLEAQVRIMQEKLSKVGN